MKKLIIAGMAIAALTAHAQQAEPAPKKLVVLNGSPICSYEFQLTAAHNAKSSGDKRMIKSLEAENQCYFIGRDVEVTALHYNWVNAQVRVWLDDEGNYIDGWASKQNMKWVSK